MRRRAAARLLAVCCLAPCLGGCFLLPCGVYRHSGCAGPTPVPGRGPTASGSPAPDSPPEDLRAEAESRYRAGMVYYAEFTKSRNLAAARVARRMFDDYYRFVPAGVYACTAIARSAMLSVALRDVATARAYVRAARSRPNFGCGAIDYAERVVRQAALIQ
jgi:hypothetical protein